MHSRNASVPVGWRVPTNRDTIRDVRHLLQEESGTTHIEYALIGTLVGVALLTALTNLGGLLTTFNTIWATIAAAAI